VSLDLSGYYRDMYIHLKPREHYEDIYDKHTVEHCRNMKAYDTDQGLTDADFEKDHLKALSPEQLREIQEKLIKKGWLDTVVKEMAVYMYAAERYNNRASTIDDWMNDDKTKDHVLTNTDIPAAAHCRKCSGRDLRLIDKHLDWHDGKNDRVLFMFSCNKCATNSAFYDDGEQRVVEPTRCPVCQSERHSFTRQEAKHKLTISYTCARCDHVWQEVLDFTPPKKEKPDPYFHEDRKLYCYSKKVRDWAADMKRSPITYSNRLSWEETQEEQDYKAELEKIEQLTIAQVEERLSQLLTKNGYKQLRLDAPNMDKGVSVQFSVIDGKADRSKDESRSTVWKLINKDLTDTNWRIMRDSLQYRMGYVMGKLQGYEGELELKKLIERRLKQQAKVHLSE
jgi:predicted Zn-ribbon and HTH transcriptional regulator